MADRPSGIWKSHIGRISCLGLLTAVLAGVGCAAESDGSISNTVLFQLDFGSGVTLSSVDYKLTGPNGFRRIGSLTVGDAPIVTATFQNLPPGQGYNIQVKGTASDDASICQGEMTFDVAASMNAMLQIPLTCSGLAAVTTIINLCPVIDSLSAIPSEVQVGATIDIVAEVRDDDAGPQPLSAIWQTDGGALSNLSTTGATFTCTSAGTFTVGMKISDGVNANSCPDTGRLTLQCTPVQPVQP
jgi:hypothetical protein